MEQYNIHTAKTQLSKLLEKVEEGNEIIIARGNEPIAVLKRYECPKKKRKGGQLKGKIWIAPDFDDNLQEIFLKA